MNAAPRKTGALEGAGKPRLQAGLRGIGDGRARGIDAYEVCDALRERERGALLIGFAGRKLALAGTVSVHEIRGAPQIAPLGMQQIALCFPLSGLGLCAYAVNIDREARRGHGAPEHGCQPVIPSAVQHRAARALVAHARALAEAGCFALVLEAVPAEVAARITQEIPIPTIGIGAGPDCDGQVLVFHDVLGLCPGLRPSFVKQYADLWTPAREALAAYCGEVRAGSFPSAAHTRRMEPAELAEFQAEPEYGDA